MGKKVEIGETMVRVITREEFDEAQGREKKEGPRVVKCDRCGETLFDGTADELAEEMGEDGHAEFVCANEEFIDPRKPRRETIVNEDGEEEIVEIERPKGCVNKTTLEVNTEGSPDVG